MAQMLQMHRIRAAAIKCAGASGYAVELFT